MIGVRRSGDRQTGIFGPVDEALRHHDFGLELGGVGLRVRQAEGMGEVFDVVDVGHGFERGDRDLLIVADVDDGVEGGDAGFVVEHAVKVHRRVFGQADQRNAAGLAGTVDQAFVVRLLETVEPVERLHDIGGRHLWLVAADGDGGIVALRPELLESIVEMLVEVLALIGNEFQIDIALIDIVENLFQPGVVMLRGRADDEIVLCARLAARGPAQGRGNRLRPYPA